MKMLLIHLEVEKDKADRMLPLLEKLKILAEVVPVNSLGEVRKKMEEQFPTFIGPSALMPALPEALPLAAKPTHVALLSALSPGWVDFLAGFSCGSHVPFIVYGDDAVKSIPEVISFCFKMLCSEEELLKYLESECEVYRRMDADMGTNAARDALLKMGTPVNNNSMVQCVYEGCLREVLFFLAAGFSPNTRSKTGVPLVNIAARNGDREMMRFLLLAGAEVNLQAEDRGTSAIVDSVMGKHYDLMMDLLKAGADVNILSKDSQNALIIAVGAGEAKMVEALLIAGADPDVLDSMGMSARKYASLFYKNTLVPLFDSIAPKKEE